MKVRSSRFWVADATEITLSVPSHLGDILGDDHDLEERKLGTLAARLLPSYRIYGSNSISLIRHDLRSLIHSRWFHMQAWRSFVWASRQRDLYQDRSHLDWVYICSEHYGRRLPYLATLSLNSNHRNTLGLRAVQISLRH
jgi:hypothetical protein